MFAERMSRIKPSPTLAASAKANALINEGIDVINFGPGEPDFDTPDHIKAACIEALHSGATKYAPVPGIPALREAIADKLRRINGLDYTASETLVTCGAKEALFAALQVLVGPGDEVLIPTPYWVSYSDQVLLCDGTPTLITTSADEGFKLSPTALDAAVTKASKVIMLNSPSNPSGIVYSRDELAALGKVCQKHGLWVISDEIYEDLVYAPATFASFGTAAPQLRDRTIIINGVSKTYAMTGWRIGWAAAPEAVIKKMQTWQGQVVSHATHFAQYGALAAYTGSQAPVAQMRQAFEVRRTLILDGLAKIPGVTCVKPCGTFFAFPNVSAYHGKSVGGRTIATAADMADYLLDEARIAVVAGEDFGQPGHLRFSYALADAQITEGLDRFAKALQQLT